MPTSPLIAFVMIVTYHISIGKVCQFLFWDFLCRLNLQKRPLLLGCPAFGAQGLPASPLSVRRCSLPLDFNG